MNHRKGLVFWALGFLMLAALALPGSLRAQGNFVYTNDDIHGPNTVSGFSVASNGTLTLLPKSPFSTKGIGWGIGFYASNRATVHTDGNFLFASDTYTNDVSVFTINKATGDLTLVKGSPFGTGGSGIGSPTTNAGIALAATPDGRFLMAANTGSKDITVFSIAPSGALTKIGYPFFTLDTPDGIKVSPDGKFLAVAEPLANQVEMFSIASNGSLTSLGAFPGGGKGNATGVDINCNSSLLYAAEAIIGTTTVDGYWISDEGTLTPVHGSPFEPGVGVNSSVALLGYGLGRETLYVSNQGYSNPSPPYNWIPGNTITAFSVAPNGSLALLHGSPFPMNSGAYAPAGMATSQDGRLLYVANFSNKVSVFSVNGWGGLTEVAGSPFPTKRTGGLLSLVAFPPRRLSLLESMLDGCPVGP